MGNNNSQNNKNRNRIILKLRERKIIVHYSYKMVLTIADAPKFPHNQQGLRLWDSNVVLARYVVMNAHQFKQKNVLQLASGTGIAGICVAKWTQAKKIAMSDRSYDVINNIKNNCSKNGIEKPVVWFKMDWNQYVNFSASYNMIVCNNPFFHKCQPQNLYDITKRFLEPGGMMIITTPKSPQIDEFLSLLDQEDYSTKKQKISSMQYLNSPLHNKVEGEQQFIQLSKGQIKIFIIKKAVIINPAQKRSKKGKDDLGLNGNAETKKQKIESTLNQRTQQQLKAKEDIKMQAVVEEKEKKEESKSGEQGEQVEPTQNQQAPPQDKSSSAKVQTVEEEAEKKEESKSGEQGNGDMEQKQVESTQNQQAPPQDKSSSAKVQTVEKEEILIHQIQQESPSKEKEEQKPCEQGIGDAQQPQFESTLGPTDPQEKLEATKVQAEEEQGETADQTSHKSKQGTGKNRNKKKKKK